MNSSEIKALYESNKAIIETIFMALRHSRKIGFRLCQYDFPIEHKEYYAAIFCLSLIDNSIQQKALSSYSEGFKKEVVAAIEDCQLLKAHVEFVLTYSPSIEWNGGMERWNVTNKGNDSWKS